MRRLAFVLLVLSGFGSLPAGDTNITTSKSRSLPEGWFGYEINIPSRFLGKSQFALVVGQSKPYTNSKKLIPAVVFSGWGEIIRGQRIGAYGYLHDYHLGKRLPTMEHNVLYVFPGPPRTFIGSDKEGATDYEKYILIELKRTVAKMWNIKSSDWRIDGISWGGLHALTLGFRFPEEFNCIYAQQPAVKRHYKVLASAIRRGKYQLSGRCVRIITATHDFYLPPTKKLDKLLRLVGADSKLTIYPGYHDKKFVRTHGVDQLLNYSRD